MTHPCDDRDQTGQFYPDRERWVPEGPDVPPELRNHASRRDNPHEVKAEQVLSAANAGQRVYITEENGTIKINAVSTPGEQGVPGPALTPALRTDPQTQAVYVDWYLDGQLRETGTVDIRGLQGPKGSLDPATESRLEQIAVRAEDAAGKANTSEMNAGFSAADAKDYMNSASRHAGGANSAKNQAESARNEAKAAQSSCNETAIQVGYDKEDTFAYMGRAEAARDATIEAARKAQTDIRNATTDGVNKIGSIVADTVPVMTELANGTRDNAALAEDALLDIRILQQATLLAVDPVLYDREIVAERFEQIRRLIDGGPLTVDPEPGAASVREAAAAVQKVGIEDYQYGKNLQAAGGDSGEALTGTIGRM